MESRAKGWYAAIDEVYQNPADTEVFSNLSHRICNACGNYLGNFEKYAKKGQRLEAPPTGITDFRYAGPGELASEHTVAYTVNLGAVKIVDRGGKSVGGDKAQSYKATMKLRYEEGKWWVVGEFER